VAVLTIPTLIVNYQKKVFITKTKYVYNVLSRAVEASIQENGTPDTWNYGSKKDANDYANGLLRPITQSELENIVRTYFLPYLKVAQIVPAEGNYFYLILDNGITLYFSTDGGTNSEGIYTPNAIYITASLNGNRSHYSDVSRDYSKKDVIMAISSRYNYKLSFFNWGGTVRNNIVNNSLYGCNNKIAKNKRFNCSALIQFDGWQIKEDYPW